jgi:hypothetical protein
VRRKFVIATTTAGVLSLSGLAVAVPALADSAGAAASSAVDRVRDALTGLVTDGSLTQEQADEVAATLAEAGLGGSGGHSGGHWGGRLDLAAAATALGMDEAGLRTALDADGATLASVAEDQGVPLDTLVVALTEAARERIAEAVTDGRIPQEEADQRLADLEERIADRVQEAGPLRGGHGGHGGRGAAPDDPAGGTTPDD